MAAKKPGKFKAQRRISKTGKVLILQCKVKPARRRPLILGEPSAGRRDPP
jgi:hypothetical protein